MAESKTRQEGQESLDQQQPGTDGLQSDSHPIGIDVGSCKIVVCRKRGDELVARTQLNAFFELPFQRFTQELLDQNQVSYFLENGSVVIIGDEAEKFALIMNAETRRPMKEGLLNPVEPLARQVIQQILELLLDPAADLGQMVCLNTPCVPAAMEPRLIYHEAILKDILMGMGYRVKMVHEGLATVLAALEETQFNGIGISFGAGMCNGCLSYLSIPVVTFGCPKGGDFVDHAAASVMDMTLAEVRRFKENELHLDRVATDRVESALQVFYDELIRSVLDEFARALKGSHNLPQVNRPLDLVLGGGSVLPGGFLERFRRIFMEYNWKVPIGDIRLVDEPLTATARGAYLAAFAEESSEGAKDR